jgi:hypothetical protein
MAAQQLALRTMSLKTKELADSRWHPILYKAFCSFYSTNICKVYHASQKDGL